MSEKKEDVVEFKDLIAAPVLSVINADFEAARKFVDFIVLYGFTQEKRSGADAKGEDDRKEPDLEKEFGDLRMVSFKYDQPGPNLAPQRTVVQLPLLSMLPLPLLTIDRADFDFNLRILDALKNTEPKKVTLLGESEKDLPDPDKYKWRAMLATQNLRKKEETQPDVSPSLDANIRVKVEVRKSDIPPGIIKLLALMGDGVQVISGWIELSPAAAKLGFGKETPEITLSAFDYDKTPLKGQWIMAQYKDQNGIRVVQGDKEWLPGPENSIQADKKGEITFYVKLLKESALKPGDASFINFEMLLKGRKVAASLPLKIVEPKNHDASPPP